MSAPPGRAYFLPPSWFAVESEAGLEVVEYPSGDWVQLQGELREAWLGARPSPVLRAMGSHNPVLARLGAGLEHARPIPLNRASVMRGAGYGQLFVELTAQCNERCVHCYAESSPERHEALGSDEVMRVLQGAHTLGFARVQLTGGDPLVSPHCVPAAQRAAALGFESVEVYTNGLALGGTTYTQLRDAGVSFAFSFYSHDASTHDAITRTPGSQQRTLAAIRRVLQDDVPCRVSMIVMDANHKQVDATLAVLHEMGLPESAVGIDVQRGVGRGLVQLRGVDAAAAELPPGQGGHREQEQFPFEGRAAVSYDGTVYPCIFSRALPLGNVREQSLEQILLAPEPLGVDREALMGATTAHAQALACWDCRVRATLLEG